MIQSSSPHNQHLSRLHHHRNRVNTIRAAIDTAVTDTVAAHYADRRAAGPEQGNDLPEPVTSDQDPPPAE